MKKSTFLFIVCLIFSNLFLHAQEDDIEKIAKDVLLETVTKYAILLNQQQNEDSTIDVCQSTTISTVYAALEALEILDNKDKRENFIKSVLPEYTKTGEALITVYDKYLSREVEQYISYTEAITTYGFNISSNKEETDDYLQPELSEDMQSSDKEFSEQMEDSEINKDKGVTYYGDIASGYITEYESVLKAYNLDAVVELANFYNKLDLARAEEYKIYLDAVLEIAEKTLDISINQSTNSGPN